MFQERIKELFDILGTSNQEIARCADCSPSTISRLRSGARKPAPHSPTVDKLIEGSIHYAVLHDHLDKLSKLTNIEDEELLDTGLRKWLYENEDAFYDSTHDSPTVSGSKLHPTFSEKFNAVMLLSELSNIRLARIVNIDTSYVSRFRNGIRSPKSNPELFDRICTALFEQITAKGMLPNLANLIEYNWDDNIDNDELYLHFHSWMDDFSFSDHDAIKHLLGTIDTFQPNFNITIPPLEQIVPDDILNDDATFYTGISGLQKAVLRFLGGAVRDNYEELLLYSDQGMEWMIEDESYRSKWVALMAMCVKQGTHIKIIHNIDRDITEMIEAVESWLPLYVSGAIESFYNHKTCGTRFSHTLFLCPGRSCITSSHPNGRDDNSLYNYHTNPVYLDYLKQDYEYLLTESSSLASILQGTPDDKDSNITPDEYYNHLSFSISQNKVIVVKNSTPKLTITFAHPLLCSAFQAYVDKAKDVQ